MKFYVIKYESGEVRMGSFSSYAGAKNYAESGNHGYEFAITEYNSEADYIAEEAEE